MRSSVDDPRRPPRRALMLLALVSSGILLAGLLLGIAAEGDSGDASTPAVATEERRLAPDFSLATLDGAETRLSDYRGRAVIVTFFASWCYPCEEELPLLEEAAREEGDDLQVLAVAYDDRRADAKEFIKRLGVTFPGLIDDDDAVAKAYGVRAIPQTFFIDADGMIQDQLFGVTTSQALDRPLQALLGNSARS